MALRINIFPILQQNQKIVVEYKNACAIVMFFIHEELKGSNRKRKTL